MQNFLSGALCLVAALMASRVPAKEPDLANRKPVAALIDFERRPIVAVLETALLATDNVNWVERTEIAKVLDEQQLQSVFAPTGGAERAKLAQLLKADLLVLVRGGEENKTPVVHVAVAEVSRGLRLVSKTHVLSADTDADVRAMQQVIAHGFAKQRAKIDAVYAVPPFLSDDLLFEYDDLRKSYPRLIEQQLLEQPNLVVVELAEADALAKELALGIDGPANRLLPYYLLGRYHNQGKGDARRVEVQLTLRHGAKELGKTSGEFPPAEVPIFLRDKTSNVVQKLTGIPPVASTPEVEAEQLLRRANEQLRLGAWEDAAALAEASSLWDPRQVEPHVTAIISLTRLIRDHGGTSVHLLSKNELVLAAYLRGVDHLLQFHRLKGDLNKYKDGGRSDFVSGLLGSVNYLTMHPESTPEIKALFVRVYTINRSKMREIFYVAANDNKLSAGYYFRHGLKGLSEEEQDLSRQQLILEIQEHPRAESLIDDLLMEGQAATYLNRPRQQRLTSVLEAQGNDTVRKMIAKYRELAAASIASSQRNKLEGKTENPVLPLEPVPPGSPRVAFQPLKWRWFDDTGKEGDLHSVDGLLPTLPGVDVAWKGGTLYISRGKGRWEQIFATGRTNCSFTGGHSSVCFDGKYLWAVLHEHRKDVRLLIIDLESSTVHEAISAHGLPTPRNEASTVVVKHQALSICPLAPGKALIAGGFGRGWLAQATFDLVKGPAISVFHEAKESENGADRDGWKNTRAAFTPNDIFLCDDSSQGKSPVCVVIRESEHVDVREHPLIVDPVTWTVSAAEAVFWPGNSSYHSPINRAVYKVAALPPNYDQLSLLRFRGTTPKLEAVFPVPREGYVFAEEERIHIIGKQWWIADMATGKTIPTGPVPWIYNNHLGASPPEPLEKFEGSKRQLFLLARSHQYGFVVGHRGRDPKELPAIEQVVFEKQPQ